MKQIQDYLQTQAIDVESETVALARAATQAVIAHAKAHIDAVLWQHEKLPEHLLQEEGSLKQLYLALDSLYSRHPVQSAVIYAWLSESGELIRLAKAGQTIENDLLVSLCQADCYLAVRTAQSGWANIASNVSQWLDNQALSGEHNRRCQAQVSLPICGEDGAVYGVVHLENHEPLAPDSLANWIGLTLGVLPTVQTLAPHQTLLSN